MLKSSQPTLHHLAATIHEQARELAKVKAALEIQFKRIADMQAELDLLRHASQGRRPLNPLVAQASSNDGNGRSDRLPILKRRVLAPRSEERIV